MLESLDLRLRRLPKGVALALGLALGAALTTVDVATGPEISFSIFYLLPIALVVWYAGPGWGPLMCVLAAAAWLAADLAAGQTYSGPSIPYWNAAVRLGFFLIVSTLLSLVRSLEAAQRESSELKSRMMSLVHHEYMNALNTMKIAGAVLRESEKDAPPSTSTAGCPDRRGLSAHEEPADDVRRVEHQIAPGRVGLGRTMSGGH